MAAAIPFSFDASGSEDTPSDVGGLEYTWSFGDGDDGNGTVATHRFKRPGNYTVNLAVTDDDGATVGSGLNITIENLAPVAGFTINPAGGNITTRFTFTSTGSDIDGNVTDWNWSFGDGTFGSGASVQHVFANDASYDITLTVWDNMGLPSPSHTATLKVANLPPTARISSERTTLKVGQRLRLGADATTDADDPLSALSFEWSFGDKSRNAAGMFANHSFSKAGRYEVTLTVRDDDGELSMAWLQVTVEDQTTTTESARAAAMVGAGIIALVVVLLVAMLLMRRRKGGTVPEKAPEGPGSGAEEASAGYGDPPAGAKEPSFGANAPPVEAEEQPATRTDYPERASSHPATAPEKDAGEKATPSGQPPVPPPE